MIDKKHIGNLLLLFFVSAWLFLPVNRVFSQSSCGQAITQNFFSCYEDKVNDTCTPVLGDPITYTCNIHDGQCMGYVETDQCVGVWIDGELDSCTFEFKDHYVYIPCDVDGGGGGMARVDREDTITEWRSRKEHDMKKFFLILSILLVLAACAPTPTQTSEVWQTSEVLPTITPTPTTTETPRPTATATPIALGVGQLDSMTNEQKLSVAPQPITAPDNIVSSFLPNQTAKDITWGAKSLAFWDRAVAYQGTTKTGESISLYYDLESGQWAKKYDSIDKIPTDKIPDVMIITDATGDHLIRNKLQYEKEKDWISQPQVLVGDKMVYLDEKGYPKAVWDTTNHKWLTPEQADVGWTLDKFKDAAERAGSYIGDNGKEYNYSVFFDERFVELLTDPTRIENLENGRWMVILNPSGEITIWSGQKDAAERAKEGAIILIGKGNSVSEILGNIYSHSMLATEIAFKEYQKGNKTIFVTYGDVGVNASEIEGPFAPFIYLKIEKIPTLKDSQGRTVSPVIRMPKFFITTSMSPETMTTLLKNNDITDPIYWLDEIIKAGADAVFIYNNQEDMERHH